MTPEEQVQSEPEVVICEKKPEPEPLKKVLDVEVLDI